MAHSASSISGSSLVWWTPLCVLHFRVWFFSGFLSFLFFFSNSLGPVFFLPSFIYLFYWALDYGIGSNFWKFYLIRTGFTLGENWFFWWKCLDCLDQDGIFWCSECRHDVLTSLSIWQGQRVFVMPCCSRLGSEKQIGIFVSV